MNLCYVSADFGIPVFGDKGASVHIQSMVSSFLKFGHDVSVVAPQLGVVPQGHRAQMHRPKTQLPKISESDLKRAEQSDRVFKERRNLAVGQSVESLVVDLNEQSRFDFIYERYSLWSSAGLRSARKLGIPLVLEVNAPLLLEQQKYRQLELSEEAEKMETEVFSGADFIYAVSEQVRNYCISKGAAPSRTSVLENGVDLDIFNPEGAKPALPFPKDLPVIGFAGSLKPWHGLEDLAAAFHLLRRRGIACGLLLVGDGPMRGWIEGFAKGTGLGEFIHLTGWVNHSQIPSYIRCMDVATAPYPKIDSFYFSPLKLFEYMACGRAVVASNIGQIASVIEGGQNGMLTEPGDPEQLANTLSELIADKEFRNHLGHQSANSMIGHGWDDCARRILEDVRATLTAPIKRRA